MSGDTKNEMEQLAKLLGQASGTLTDFPQKLQSMTDNLSENFKELQEVVKQISRQTFVQSEDSINQMKKQIEDMSKVFHDQIGGLQNGQETLIKEQSKNIQVSESLLIAFNTSIEKMNGLSNGVSETINKLNEAHEELEHVISTFRNISTDVNVSSSKFSESQNTFAKYSNEFLQNNSALVVEIQNSLSTAKEVSTDYAQKFGVIEKGLQVVFTELNTGLKEYQSTISQSLETFLGLYAEHHTAAIDSLSKALSKQEMILEELSEQLSLLKGTK
jgi:archaellum component FlaC